MPLKPDLVYRGYRVIGHPKTLQFFFPYKYMSITLKFPMPLAPAISLGKFPC